MARDSAPMIVFPTKTGNTASDLTPRAARDARSRVGAAFATGLVVGAATAYAFNWAGVGLGLEREDAVEIFYNASITSWLNATLDLQVIEPAPTKKLGSSGGLEGVDTTVVAGLRLHVRF
ncbi:MAG: carbohydrate porin [Candidatus Rokuibacteriota bacterium]